MTEIERLNSMSIGELLEELRARTSKDTADFKMAMPGPDSALEGIDDAAIVSVLKEKQKVIYGRDDRVDLFQLPEGPDLNDADCVVALFRSGHVSDNGDGTSTLRTVTFGASYNLCPGERFRDQPTGAFCTGFLVEPNVIATAGHCVNADNVTDVRFVFGFRMRDATTAETIINNSEIYRGLSLIGHQLDGNGADWCLVRIDRSVTNHRVARVRRSGRIGDNQRLHVIGHPAGLPTKFADSASVRDNDTHAFFVANLDTYGGNSGSPVFNSDSHEVEGILVRGETDFVQQGSCNVSLVCPTSGCRGEDCTRATVFSHLIDQPDLAISKFGYDAGTWRVENHPRFLADLTGDNRADVVGFGDAGVYVALNNGDGSFKAPEMVVTNFGYNAGTWRVERHPRFLADLTGNGCADIIGFGNAGVFVALNNGDGSFKAPERVVSNFGYDAGGWRIEQHPRFVADLTGDGRGDIVGFGNAGVYVALNNGGGSFNSPELVVPNFGFTAGSWRVQQHPRVLADLTGNGCADIVGFGNAGVYVALNNGDGSFQTPKLAVANFGYNAGGWRVQQHPRLLADLTGDGRADIVGFGWAGVYVALNNGDGSFQSPEMVVANFGYNAGGWRIQHHPRFLSDVTGNGCADIVGFGNAGVYVARNNGNGTFQATRMAVPEFGYNAGGWRVDKHPRLLGELTGDARSDIVGFGSAGVWVAKSPI